LLRDDDTEFDLIWYPARPEDGTLPFPTSINSLDWYHAPFLKEGTGEVWGAKRPFVWQNPLTVETTRKPCGAAADFLRGGRYDPSPPFPHVGPSGLPDCCLPEPPPTPPWVSEPCTCADGSSTIL